MRALFCVIVALLASTSARAQQPAPTGASDVVLPVKVANVNPIYPEAAGRAGIYGRVVIEVKINRTGVVETARVLQSVPELDEAALVAVRQWQYTPGTRAGQPIDVVTRVPVRFSPDNSIIPTDTWKQTARGVISIAKLLSRLQREANVLAAAHNTNRPLTRQEWLNISAAISREFASELGPYKDMAARQQQAITDLLEEMAFAAPAACGPVSTFSAEDKRELHAREKPYDTWARVMSDMPLVAGKPVDVRWRMDGGDMTTLVAYSPSGTLLVPTAFGAHPDKSRSEWNRLKNKQELGSLFTFPRPGCWNLHVMRSGGSTADLWIDVVAAQGQN